MVGDPSQTIYSFTGATPHHLLTFAAAHPGRRGDPAGARLPLHPAGRGPREPAHRAAQRRRGTPGARARRAAPGRSAGRLHRLRRRRVRGGRDRRRGSGRLVAAGTRASEIAVLYRTNAQSEAFEQALAAAGIGYLVRGGERFFARREVREAIVLLRGAGRVGRRRHPDAGGRAGRPAHGRLVAAAARRPAVRRGSGGSPCRRWSALADDLAARRQATLVGPARRARRARVGAARADRRGRHPRVAARRQGPGVGRRLPRRAQRGAHADLAGRDRRRGGRGAAAALRRDHPRPRAPGAVLRAVAEPAAAGPRGSAPRFLDGLWPEDGPGHRRGSGHRLAAAAHRRVRRARSSSGSRPGAPRSPSRRTSPPTRCSSTRRWRRSRRPGRPRWPTSPGSRGSARPSSTGSVRRCSRWCPAHGRRAGPDDRPGRRAEIRRAMTGLVRTVR